MNGEVKKRDIIDKITPFLKTDNIIVLHGARQVGKTHILYYLQNELKVQGQLTKFLDLEDARFVDLLDEGVEVFLAYLKNEGFDLDGLQREKKVLSVFIDEIQYLRNPSSFLKLLGDHHKYLRLIVSGSSSFDIKSKFKDSLVGRTINFEIFNLSFKEFIRFKGLSYNLDAALDSLHLSEVVKLYEEYIYFGGYPKVILEDAVALKEKYLRQIIDTYVKKDVRDLAAIKQIQKFNTILKVLAAQSGQLLNIADLSRVGGVARQTVEHYLFILESTYIIKLVAPFSNSARVAAIKSPKIFFYDTGLLQMLRVKSLPKQLTGDVFETSVFSELIKKYGQDSVNFWRSRAQAEIDFILQSDGNILPIEVKKQFKSFKRQAVMAFGKKFKVSDYRVVSLFGAKDDDHFAYPWEL